MPSPEAAKPSGTREVKQEAIGERTEKEGESTRITRLAQERLDYPLTVPDCPSQSYKTNNVVPPVVVIYSPGFSALGALCRPRASSVLDPLVRPRVAISNSAAGR
jgi:hypothetical protein